MLSTKSSTSFPSSSRKYSATVKPVKPTLARAPGGSFIYPYTNAQRDPLIITKLRSINFNDTRCNHFVVEIISFSSSFSNSCKHRVTSVRLGDIINKFLNEHCFSYSGTSEKSNFTSSGIWSQQIDDLDTSNQQFGSRSLFLETWGFSVDRVVFISLNRSSFVDGFTDNIHDTT
jgi:hypothetical protein